MHNRPFKYDTLPTLQVGKERKRLVALTGAGISVESGLPSFRDKDGLWEKYDWKRLCRMQAWVEEPASVLEFYNLRRRNLLTVQPNHAHLLLAELEKWYDVSIITQNVDNLHECAGSTDILHLHGELTKVTSSIDKNNPANIQSLSLDVPIQLGDTAADKSQLRPYVVWFDEKVLHLNRAISKIRTADVFVVIGCSLKVDPAAQLVRYARPDAQKFIINPKVAHNPYDEYMADEFLHIQENATIGMETLIDILANGESIC
jgi:NAD-dependent deacetylase